MKITDLKCAIMGGTPIIRITTDAGIDGYGQAEFYKSYLKQHVLYYREMILGLDPTNVEAVMQRIRRMGAFKPWGAAVSAIEIALWDIAGKAANLPVYKLLGGKVRDKVRTYITTNIGVSKCCVIDDSDNRVSCIKGRADRCNKARHADTASVLKLVISCCNDGCHVGSTSV